MKTARNTTMKNAAKITMKMVATIALAVMALATTVPIASAAPAEVTVTAEGDLIVLVTSDATRTEIHNNGPGAYAVWVTGLAGDLHVHNVAGVSRDVVVNFQDYADVQISMGTTTAAAVPRDLIVVGNHAEAGLFTAHDVTVGRDVAIRGNVATYIRGGTIGDDLLIFPAGYLPSVSVEDVTINNHLSVESSNSSLDLRFTRSQVSRLHVADGALGDYITIRSSELGTAPIAALGAGRDTLAVYGTSWSGTLSYAAGTGRDSLYYARHPGTGLIDADMGPDDDVVRLGVLPSGSSGSRFDGGAGTGDTIERDEPGEYDHFAATITIDNFEVNTLDLPVPTLSTPAMISIDPARVLETRTGAGMNTVDGLFQGTGTIAGGTHLELPLVARGGIPDQRVRAVVMNITSITPSGAGWITAYPCGTKPVAASLNYNGNDVRGNEIIAELSPTGTVCLYSHATTDLAVDATGYIPTSSTYRPVVPARILETRTGAGLTTIDGQFQGTGQIAGGTHLELAVAGRYRIPATHVKAVVMNITSITPSGAGWITAYPCGTMPLAASLNYDGNDVRGNEIIAPVSPAGTVCLYSQATTDLVVDATGFIPTSSAYQPSNPARILDTRNGAGLNTIDGQFQGTGQIAAGTRLVLGVTGRGGIPASGVESVVMNVTSITPTGPGWISAYPCNTPPLAASLNYGGGDIRGNEIIAQVSPSGNICLYTHADTHLVVDATGYIPKAQN